MEITIAGKVFPFIKMRQGSYFDKRPIQVYFITFQFIIIYIKK